MSSMLFHQWLHWIATGLLASSVALLVDGPPAQTVTTNWNNNIGGSCTLVTNWNNGVPKLTQFSGVAGTFNLTGQAPSYVGREGSGASTSNCCAVVNSSPHKPHPRQGSTARRYFDLPNANLRPNVFWPSPNQRTARSLRTPTLMMRHLAEFN